MNFQDRGMHILFFMSDEVLPPEEFSEIAVWKTEQRKCDMEDIASGRRTPEEIERDNSRLIPHPEECVPLNMIEACEKL
jgi:hypothetical protein